MSKWFVRKTRTRSPSRRSFFSTSGDSQLFLAATFLTVVIIVLGPTCARADVDDVKLVGDDQADRTASGLWPWLVKRGYVAPVSPAAPQAVLGSGMLGPTGRSWTQQTTSGVRAWNGIACDATCTKLVAVATSDVVYTSTDSGATWTQQTGSLIAGYQGVASSSAGTELVAVAPSLDIQTSDDSGVTWTDQAGSGPRTWWWVACDLTCTNVAAVETYGYIYTSTDSGVSWTGRAVPRPWLRIASSSDGTKLAATDFCRIWTSDDSGVTWIARDSDRGWIGIASSVDGTRLIAAANGDFVYLSIDSGVTWTAQPALGARNWQDVACDSTCTTMMAAEYGGNIYVSDDSGSSWVAQSQAGSHEWNAIAMSADGTKLVAAEFGGTVWTSILKVDAAQATRRPTLKGRPAVSWTLARHQSHEAVAESTRYLSATGAYAYCCCR